MIPVALATLATLRSISAQRMTKVSPAAMIPVMEIWVRILERLPTVRKEGLARLKNRLDAYPKMVAFLDRYLK